MKFSESTINVLKNFSEINPSVLFTEGNVLRTISPQKTAMASAVVTDKFEGEAAVYELTRFLSTLSLFNDPDVIFKEDKFLIKGGRSSVKYAYASKNMIMTPPEKDIEVQDPEVTIDIAWDDLQTVIKAAGVLQLGEISFRCDGKEVYMSAGESKNPTADDYSVLVAEVDKTDNFDMIIKVENLKLLPADYTVSLSTKGLAHFKSENIQYWIALEAN